MDTGKIAVVTGASGAIGSATVAIFRERGYRIVHADCAFDTTESDSERECFIKLDVRDPVAVRAAMASLAARWGGIDVLVNVAGVTSTGASGGLSTSEWARVLDINLSGTFWCCQAALPYMREKGWGRVINLGSILGKNGGNARPWLNADEQAGSGNVAYGVSKAGVHAMTAYLAKETAGSGITVNAVAPGPVSSDMTTALPPSILALIPVGRIGRPADVAAAIAFLASEQASFITGEVLDLNGGMWCD